MSPLWGQRWSFLGWPHVSTLQTDHGGGTVIISSLASWIIIYAIEAALACGVVGIVMEARRRVSVASDRCRGDAERWAAVADVLTLAGMLIVLALLGIAMVAHGGPIWLRLTALVCIAALVMATVVVRYVQLAASRSEWQLQPQRSLLLRALSVMAATWRRRAIRLGSSLAVQGPADGGVDDPMVLPWPARGRWPLYLGGIALAGAVAVESVASVHVPELSADVSRVALNEYFALIGLSLMLTLSPAVVFIWMILVMVSGRTQIRRSLRVTADIAGRGLVGGLLTAVVLFALAFAPSPVGQAFARVAASQNWLDDFIVLPAAGTVIGFGFAHFVLLDIACRSIRRPRWAWLLTPPALTLAVAVSAAFYGPRENFEHLVAGLVDGLDAPQGGKVTAALIQSDPRYLFYGDQTAISSLVPPGIAVVVCVGVVSAWLLWTQWNTVPGDPESEA